MKSLTRTSVLKRLEKLSEIQRNAESISAGGIENLRKLTKSRRLYRETCERFPDDRKETASVNLQKGLTWEMITQNGKYSLD